MNCTGFSISNALLVVSILSVLVFEPTSICLAQSTDNVQFTYTSPKPNSKLHYVSTNIVLRTRDKISAHKLARTMSFVIHGSESGHHKFEITLCKDHKTIILDPVKNFNQDEKVSLTAFGINDEVLIQFDFVTSARKTPTDQEFYGHQKTIDQEKSIAALDYTITTNNFPHEGNLFFATFGQPQTPVNIIDTSGTALYSEDWGMEGWEWKVNLNDHLTFFDRATTGWVVMNSHFERVDTVFCVNGYTTDYHEILALPNGNYLIMAYDEQEFAMDTVVPGGNPNALVEGLIIQELDADHNLLLQWRSWDHYEVTDNIYLDLTGSNLKFIHGNSIDIDFDGNLIISARDLDEITKINRQTGEIIWRLGGSQSDFTLLNSYPFSGQHCARSTGNNRYLLFDNGNYSAQYNNGENVSRAVEIELDTVNMTSTMIWEYKHESHFFTPNLGSVQRLTNGSTLMVFGNLAVEGHGGIILEVDTNDQVTFELECAFGQSIYRAHKHAWYFDEEIVGCTDSSACNFDPNAIFSDNTCLNQINPPIIVQDGQTLSAISNISSAVAHYVWSTGENGASIQVSEIGEYWVLVQGANNCESDTAYYNVATLGLHPAEPSDSKVIEVYDLRGRSTTFEPGKLLLYRMDDGTVRKEIREHQ